MKLDCIILGEIFQKEGADAERSPLYVGYKGTQ